MTTPIYFTGFEYGVATFTANGAGLCNTVTGSPSCSTSYHNSGAYSLKLALSAATGYITYLPSTNPTILVGRFYFLLHSGNTTNLLDISPSAGFNATFAINASGHLAASFSGSGTVDYGLITADQWYRVDFKVDWTANPSKLDWQVGGVAQTQVTYAEAATNTWSVQLGSTLSATVEFYLDDVVLSGTSGDYPIGPGGTELLLPTSDGTNNAGTNCMEWQDGTDIAGTFSAYSRVNSVPMGGTTTYLRQNTGGGTANYVTVNCADISATHSAIIGSMGYLAYMAASTTTDKGACFATVDNFSTSTTIWGTKGTTADYSESSVFWKRAIITGGTNDTNVNALAIRMGHSDDTNPIPYWIDTAVEVAYAIATSTAYSLTVDVGTYAESGVTSTLEHGYRAAAVLGTYALTGPAANLAKGKTMTAALGTFALTGLAPGLKRSYRAAAVLGTYAQTGVAPNLEHGYRASVALGSYTQTGIAALLKHSYRVAAVLGTYSETGLAAGLLRGRYLSVTVGSYVQTGITLRLLHGYRNAAALGLYTLTGIDAILNKSGGGLHFYTMSVNVGAYAQTGPPDRLIWARIFSVSVGSYALTGVTDNLLWKRRMIAALGNYGLAGLAAPLLKGRYLSASTGNYTLNGLASTLLWKHRLAVLVGPYLLAGLDASLTYTGAPFPYQPTQPLIRVSRGAVGINSHGRIRVARDVIQIEHTNIKAE